jgi:hypothetical protein
LPHLSFLIFLAACQCEAPVDETQEVEEETQEVDSEPVPEEVGCDEPEEILTAAGDATGFERCADGSVNRVQADTSFDLETYDELVPPCPEGGSAHGGCETDSECTAYPIGRCYEHTHYFGQWCRCTYLCSSNNDCNGRVCVPGELLPYGWSRCTEATCGSNADCESGECGLATIGQDYVVEHVLACRTEQDECRTNQDCQDSPGWENYCEPADGRWTCVPFYPND